MDTIRNTLSLPWGGERNLAMRAALGLVEGDICAVHRGDYIQVVVPEHGRANVIARSLKMALGSTHDVRVNVRADRAYVVSATERGRVDPLAAAKAVLGR